MWNVLHSTNPAITGTDDNNNNNILIYNVPDSMDSY